MSLRNFQLQLLGVRACLLELDHRQLLILRHETRRLISPLLPRLKQHLAALR